MPIYEYRCDTCGQDFELFRSISDQGVPQCKFCKGPVKKLISRSSFHLKGTGWYVTDYAGKKKSDGQEEKKEEATGSSGSETTAKKEDSAPKAKTETSSD